MFCPNCGTALPDAAIFCANCGARVAAPSSGAPAARTDPSSSSASVGDGNGVNPSVAGEDSGMTAEQDSTPAAKAGILAAAVPAASAKELSKKKKTAVVLAVISLVFGALAPYIDELGFFVFMSRYSSAGEYFNSLLHNLFAVCWDFTLPLVLGGLFVLFCSRLGRSPTLLTGIPKAVSVGLFFITTFFDLLRGNYPLSAGNLITIFAYLSYIAFVIFYMFGTSKKQSGNPAWRILTLILGIFILSLKNLALFMNMRSFFSGFSFSSFLSLTAGLHGLLSEIFMVIAMIFIVFNAAIFNRRENT